MTTADIAEGKYLVTGATGRTGSHVVRKLVNAGAQVRALVHSTAPDDLPKDGVEYVQGDYEDLDSLKAAAEGVDYVIAIEQHPILAYPSSFALGADDVSNYPTWAAPLGLPLLHIRRACPAVHRRVK